MVADMVARFGIAIKGTGMKVLRRTRPDRGIHQPLDEIEKHRTPIDVPDGRTERLNDVKPDAASLLEEGDEIPMNPRNQRVDLGVPSFQHWIGKESLDEHELVVGQVLVAETIEIDGRNGILQLSIDIVHSSPFTNGVAPSIKGSHPTNQSKMYRFPPG